MRKSDRHRVWLPGSQAPVELRGTGRDRRPTEVVDHTLATSAAERSGAVGVGEKRGDALREALGKLSGAGGVRLTRAHAAWDKVAGLSVNDDLGDLAHRAGHHRHL